jgi:hypothetical protein
LLYTYHPKTIQKRANVGLFSLYFSHIVNRPITGQLKKKTCNVTSL